MTKVGPERRVEVATPELEPGAEVEVIVLAPLPPSKPRRTMVELIGAGRGMFPNPGDVERHLREVRDGCQG